MKKLKKILLINWLNFSKQLIEVDDINFLTGKNGAGKSTLIDALQIVLLGETNTRNFNKAASGKSDRPLDSYLRADLDPKSPNNRKGKDFSSYIACEFWDDVKGSKFVLGIVFDSYADNSRVEHFFIFDGAIPDNHFIENARAIDTAALYKQLNETPKCHHKFYGTNKSYRDAMLSKLNVHENRLFEMLKKAVSFTPINDVERFITENVCDVPEKIQTEEMQATIRDYQRHEQIAARHEKQLAELESICTAYAEMNQALERWKLQEFLVSWASKEDLYLQQQRLEQELSEKKESKGVRLSQQKELTQTIQEKNARQKQLEGDILTNKEYQERERLNRQYERLLKEEREINETLEKIVCDIKIEAIRLRTLCTKIIAVEKEPLFIELQEIALEVQMFFEAFEVCQLDVFVERDEIFWQAQEIKTRLVEALRALAFTLQGKAADKRRELQENEEKIAKLKRDVKDYPAALMELKALLQNSLQEEQKQAVSVEVLADVLEICEGEESWRGAIEGYLNTQKFYLLVAPVHYPAALRIYNQWKEGVGGQTFGLVDIERLQEKESLEIQKNSLAQKIETKNELARVYIDFLLGKVICCNDIEALRVHRISIMESGMLYHGYVARRIPMHRMNNLFIGQKAVAYRLEQLNKQQTDICAMLQRLQNQQLALQSDAIESVVFTPYFANEMQQRYKKQFVRVQEIVEQKEDTLQKIDACDIFWVDNINKEISQLVQEVKKLEEEKEQCSKMLGQLEERIRVMEYESLPEVCQSFTEKEALIEEKYDSLYIEHIGEPRYQKELVRLRFPKKIVQNFYPEVSKSDLERERAQKMLFDLRKEYERNYAPCHFEPESLENSEYEQERTRLQESELPAYYEKIRKAKESALEQFQNDFLSKLKSNIENLRKQIWNLNKALKQAQFGADQYQFRMDKNPDYSAYYDMIFASELMDGEGGLFAIPFQQKYGALVEELFSRIVIADDTKINVRKQSELEKNIALYTDFRTYLKFDLETIDKNGHVQLLSQTLKTKSGGETQTPFYIAILASFAQLYHVYDKASLTSNTMRLVIFDEAFSKMDGERIIESVRLLRKMNLQAIICTPPDKLPDIMPEADQTLVAMKERYKMQIIPYSKEIENTWSEIVS